MCISPSITTQQLLITGRYLTTGQHATILTVNTWKVFSEKQTNILYFLMFFLSPSDM
jgi:hypothetical protein